MKCFNHPDVDAVGSCSNCGKGGCRDCLSEIEGMLLCGPCYETYREVAIEEACEERKQLRSRIIRSYFMAVAGFVLGLIVAFSESNARQGLGMQLLMVVLFTYAVWSTYWGAIMVRPFVRKIREKLDFILFLPLMGWLFLIFLYIGIVFELSLIYGMAGGAIWAFIKHRRDLEAVNRELEAAG